MKYVLEDWTNSGHCRIAHYDDLTVAEDRAIQIMDTINPPMIWGRGEWSSNLMEYTKRNASGMARVYVRIYERDELHPCDRCESVAHHQTRAGWFCDYHFGERYSGVTDAQS